MTTQELSEKIGRTKSAIQAKPIRLGLKKYNRK